MQAPFANCFIIVNFMKIIYVISAYIAGPTEDNLHLIVQDKRTTLQRVF